MPVTASLRNSFCPTASGVTRVKDVPLPPSALSDVSFFAAALHAVAAPTSRAVAVTACRVRRVLRDIGETFRGYGEPRSTASG